MFNWRKEIANAIEEAKETQKKQAALVPYFDTEEEALAYAKCVAALKPGDTVRLINENGDGLHPGVFVCAAGRTAVFLFYNRENGKLATQIASWHGIVLD